MASGVGHYELKAAGNDSTSLLESKGPVCHDKIEGRVDNTSIEEKNILTCKHRAGTDRFQVSSLAQGPPKRQKLISSTDDDKTTVAAWPFISKNAAIHTNILADVSLRGLWDATSGDLDSQKVSHTSHIESTLQECIETSEEKDSKKLHSFFHKGSTQPILKSSRAPCEVYVHKTRPAHQPEFAVVTSTLHRTYSPDLSAFYNYEACSVGDYTSCTGAYNHGNSPQLESNEQLSPRSWSQECYGLPKSSNVALYMSEIEACVRGAAKGPHTVLNNGLCANQAPNSHTAECRDSIDKVETEVEIPICPISSNESPGAIRGSHCLPRVYECLHGLQGHADKITTTNPTGFSFQRLINGDITGLEHEFDEFSEEDCGTDVEELEHDDSDMYSTVCTPTQTLSPKLEVCVDTPEWKFQHSDDTFHSDMGFSFDGRGESVELDSEISEVPLGMDKIAPCNKDYKIHGSPCLQPKIDPDCQPTCSDSSKDLYTESVSCHSRHKERHVSPFLNSCLDVYRPISPDVSPSEEYPYSYRQHQYHGSPCMHPISKLDEQSFSDVSEDLSICPRPRDTSFGINRLKDETATSSTQCNETFEGWLKRAEEGIPTLDVPGTAKALLSSGLCDGYLVSYKSKGGEVLLTGIVKKGGILCNCRLCKGRTVVNVSCFEKHAGSTARHPSEHIFFENGKSLHDILRAGWHSSDGKSAYSAHNAMRKNTSAEIANKDSNGGRSPVIVTPSRHKHRVDVYVPKISQTLPPPQRRDLNRILFLPGGLPDGTEVAYYIKGQRILSGTKMGHGIHCCCCNEVISCSSFEAHAGWGSRRNPYQCIFLSDGQSLHKYAQSLALKLQVNSAVETTRENDDLCGECGDGGDLVLCDACPGAYHTECLGLASIPEGEWFCPLCEDKVQRPRDDSKQSGEIIAHPCQQRLSTMPRRKGVERCQRVVKASKNSIGGCAICKNGDFLKMGFGAKTVLLCDQCEREFHVGCLKEKNIVDLQELPHGEWFCGSDCTRIHKVLQELVLSGPQPVCSSLCNMVDTKQQQAEKPQVSDFTWQLLHGRRGDPRNGKILSEAASIFAESFDPIVDATSGRDLISVMVHSRSIRDQDFGGMYCAVLKRKEIIVSTAMIRVFGSHFAEMPLVATSTAYRGQGFFQMLMLHVERLLGMVQVEHLVLPATSEAEGIWLKKFGFLKLNDKQVQKFESEVQIMMFQGSSMLLKSIV